MPENPSFPQSGEENTVITTATRTRGENIRRIAELTASIGEQIDRGAQWYKYVPLPACIGNGSKLIDVNDAFCEVLGWTHDEIMKSQWVTFVHPHDLVATAAAINTSEKMKGHLNRWKAKSGIWLWWKWHWSELVGGYNYCAVVPVEDQGAVELEELAKERASIFDQLRRENAENG